jgi:hypothetical protein
MFDELQELPKFIFREIPFGQVQGFFENIVEDVVEIAVMEVKGPPRQIGRTAKLGDVDLGKRPFLQ